MPVMSPYEGAKSEREDANRGLLEAVATAGAEGKKAYQAARDAVGQQRQGALDRAAQQAQMTGQNFGPAATAPVMQEADRFGTYYAGQEAAGQQHLQNIGASGSSYLAKVGAIAPFMQQKALDQAAGRENQYKIEIAQNQAKIDAEKAAEELAHKRQLEMMALRNQYDIAGDTRSYQNQMNLSNSKATAEKKATLPKIEELFAAATTATDLQKAATPNNRLIDTHPQLSEILMSAADKSAYNGTDYKEEVARALGETGYNLTPTQLNTIFYQNAPKAEQDQAANALATKYDNKGVTTQLAKSVLGNVDFQKDVAWILSGAEGASREEATELMRKYYTQDRPWNSEFVVLVGEYLPLLPTQAQLDKQGG